MRRKTGITTKGVFLQGIKYCKWKLKKVRKVKENKWTQYICFFLLLKKNSGVFSDQLRTGQNNALMKLFLTFDNKPSSTFSRSRYVS